MIERLLLLYWRLRDLIARRSSIPYKIGDVVELADGSGYPMLVTEIHRLKGGRILFYCKWYDTVNKDTRFNLFPAEKLKPFDWNVRVV